MSRFLLSMLLVGRVTATCRQSSLQDYSCDSTTCRGYLAYKPSHCTASQKCPAVVVIQDWNGMNHYEKERAGMLADMGYVGFAADIYGLGTPVENMMHWMAASGAHRANSTLYMSKIQAALTKVKSYEFVNTAKIAVVGYCFGGTGIVNMAILGSDVLGVVGYHSGIAPDSRVKVSDTHPVTITAKVLLHSGGKDDNSTHIAMLEQEFERGNATYEIVRYGSDVFHSFTEWSAAVPGMAMYNPRADYRSWESTKKFLVELFDGLQGGSPQPTANNAISKMLQNYTCSGNTCEGYISYKAATCSASTKCPAVVVIHDWNGMNTYEKQRADMLAGMDYVGFAADIYGYGTPVENMGHWAAASGMHRGNPALYMDKITAALVKVKSYAFVDAAKIAVIGYCFGGTGIINMALMGSDVLGVVGYHSGLSGRVMRNKTHPVAVTTKILLHSGVMDDQATDVAALEQDFEDAKATYEIARYGNKVLHSFTHWGSYTPGWAMYNARADYRSWESTKLFLKELFTGMPQPVKSASASSCSTSGGSTGTTSGGSTGSASSGSTSSASSGSTGGTSSGTGNATGNTTAAPSAAASVTSGDITSNGVTLAMPLCALLGLSLGALQ